MGVATGFTKERMLMIENTTVVDGHVDGDNLVLVTREGQEIDAGDIRGPQGPGPQYVEFTFAVAQQTWTCVHNLGQDRVMVVTVDNNDEEIEGEVDFVDDNTVVVIWYFPISGKATIRS